MTPNRRCILLAGVALTLATGCAKKESVAHDSPATASHHQHIAPHGGTAVVLGDEACHLELVLDVAAGKLNAYVLDGEMEKYLRVSAPSFTVVATVAGEARPLVFTAQADSATGETVGNTAAFAATADWLKTTPSFDAVLTRLEIRGVVFAEVPFNFPKGNERH